MDTHRLNKWKGKQRFIECFVCGDENAVVFVPDDKIFEWYDKIEPNRKGHIFMTILPQGDRLVMRIGHGKPDIDAREYLNRFDFISPAIPRPAPRIVSATAPMAQTAWQEIEAAIMADVQLSGDSLHDRTIDMIAQIGEWLGYKPKKSFSVESNSPYLIDIAWLKGEEVDLAAEVHVGGNETEAKDRLRQALRFGARKVVIICVPTAIPRLRSVCKFEAELKNWLEIWSIPRIYKMYRNGKDFFDEFSPFRKRQRSNEVTEYQ